MSNEEVEAVYQKLKKLTKVTKEEKEIHIQDIKENTTKSLEIFQLQLLTKKRKSAHVVEVCWSCGQRRKAQMPGNNFGGVAHFQSADM